MKQIIKKAKSTIGNPGAMVWLLIWFVYLYIIFTLDIKKLSEQKSAYYIIIALLILGSAAIFSQFFSIRMKYMLGEKEKEVVEMSSKLTLLEEIHRGRTEALDAVNIEFKKKTAEHDEISSQLRVHRDELGHLVRERTLELEKMADEMNENQKALMYLVEDVNDSRNELEGLNKKLNKTLKEAEISRDRIDAILRSVADGLVVTDFNSNILMINHVAELIFDVKSEKIIGNDIHRILELEKLLGREWTKFEEKEQSNFDFEINMRIYNARMSAIWGGNGLVTGMIIIFRDVTHERKLDASKNEFISTSTHELRTPLTSIRGFSEILLTRDDITEDEKKKFLEYINRQAISLGKIINDLLDLSKIEAGESYKLNKSDFYPNEMVDEVISNFKEISGGFNFEVIINDKGSLFADKVLITQAFTNLISNSIKYSPLGGDIIISSIFEEKNYILIVQDHGMGMTKAQTEKVFDKFYRVDSTNTAIEGTGLGMSIIKNIVDAHSGDINIQSIIDVGTTMKIVIPSLLSIDIKEHQKNKKGEGNEKNPDS